MELKRSKIIRLPTKDKSFLFTNNYNSIKRYDGPVGIKLGGTNNPPFYNNQHLYFTTDEEIKKGNWYLELFDGKYKLYKQSNDKLCFSSAIKIIATTDELSTQCECKHGSSCDNKCFIPQPSQAFIEKYVKVGGIDEVMVEYNKNTQQMVTRECNGGIIDKFNKITHSLKVDSHNTITIHPIKNSWSKEEIETLLDAELKAYEKEVPHPDDSSPGEFVERFLNNL
jgi:hypothetical protein